MHINFNMKQETIKRRVEQRGKLDEIPAEEVTLKIMKKNENIPEIE